jgi:hypothetical protein
VTATATLTPGAERLHKQLPSLRKELYTLLVRIKRNEDWRSIRKDFADFAINGPPCIDVTIGCTFNWQEGEITWNYQTGDNSFTGGAYGHPEWFTTSIMSRSNCKEIVDDLISEIEGRISELASGFFPFGQ